MEEIKFDRINDIWLCPIESKDDEFLLRVFKESRSDLDLIAGISEEQKEMFIVKQFKMERQQLKLIYPNTEFNIIKINEEPVGRVYVYNEEFLVRILEIGILEMYRGYGIGKEVLNTIIKNSVLRGKKVNLQVAWFNQKAYELYESLGFRVVENTGIFLEMQYMY